MAELEKAKSLMTLSGANKLKAELEDLKVVQRKDIAERIQIAREQGDLSENAEYDAAMDKQRDIEARIKEIETILKDVEIIDEASIDANVVNLGSTVVVHDGKYNEELTFYVVGSNETDSINGKISNESPLGVALMGKRAGDVVVVDSPIGSIQYEVISVSKTK